MNIVTEAKTILTGFGIPSKTINERSALTLLALANIKSTSNWSDAKQQSMSVVGSKDGKGKYPGIMSFINNNYSDVRSYLENSRESFRDETIKPFLQAGLIEHNPEEPGLSPNSRNNHYRLTLEALNVIKNFGSEYYQKELEEFKKIAGTLIEKYAKARNLLKVPIKLSNGQDLILSPGKHNVLQVAIIKEFAEIFAHGSELVYLGDTTNRGLHLDENLLNSLCIHLAGDTKLPDVILYDKNRDWLFLIEAVTSVGPMSPKRMIELEKLLENCKSGKIFVTAFPDSKIFRKFVADIAWETEVWIADNPTHLIHFNGNKFLGPR